ncbi:hypothetical protein P153DRAFT_366378 [Dothidotthia symphoricarpi CBS 119687]|uniref:Uncharacterized protein n=1 Tax=Dothidotthia symphoricarpi CBS 119687 TaxID=1392245 RepID=A0A6A6AFI1_9PLEO|nr:uncharacterized protein P153DRAFT_366378 [Dothidotthia symphoricarpi CBS 119687]KAF2129875.1 hypothetical protein P153DRAFT_366378 [Dothidotthia symphoricarpi CBS 119687]
MFVVRELSGHEAVANICSLDESNLLIRRHEVTLHSYTRSCIIRFIVYKSAIQSPALQTPATHPSPRGPTPPTSQIPKTSIHAPKHPFHPFPSTSTAQTPRNYESTPFIGPQTSDQQVITGEQANARNAGSA